AVVTDADGASITIFDRASVTTVEDGFVVAHDQTWISNIVGGELWSFDAATVEKTNGGVIVAHNESTIHRIMGGEVFAKKLDNVAGNSLRRVTFFDEVQRSRPGMSSSHGSLVSRSGSWQ